MVEFGRPIAAFMAGAALLLAAGPASAAVGQTTDPAGDAIYHLAGAESTGDYDIDLRRLNVDHGTERVAIQAGFTYLSADSWTHFEAEIDTNADRQSDFRVRWDRESPDVTVSAVGRSGAAVRRIGCSGVDVQEKRGVEGSLTVSLPRSCLSYPKRVAIQVTAKWAEVTGVGEKIYFVDTAPGDYRDRIATFSAPVASSQTGTASSRKVAKIKTYVAASLSKARYKVGAAPALLRVRGTAVDGTLKISVAGRLRSSVRVDGGEASVFRLSALKRGTHRVTVEFLPAESGRYLGASQTLRVNVVR